ncbi:MAG: hypothetical protein ABFR63_12545, partial [Thermodesulfobacteriota bacterium]
MKLLPGFVNVVLLLPVLFLVSGCAEMPRQNSLLVKKVSPPEIVAVNGHAKLIPAGLIKRRLQLGYPHLESII